MKRVDGGSSVLKKLNYGGGRFKSSSSGISDFIKSLCKSEETNGLALYFASASQSFSVSS